jgi:ribonuclease HI
VPEKIIIYTDGGARNNPGPAGAGVIAYEMIAGEKAREIFSLKKFLGPQTNNYAEYEAVYLALTELKERYQKEVPGTYYCIATVEVRLDSKLVAEQLMGNWKIKEPTLKPQWAKVRTLMNAHFPHITFTHIPREENSEADRLVNEAIDEAGF